MAGRNVTEEIFLPLKKKKEAQLEALKKREEAELLEIKKQQSLLPRFETKQDAEKRLEKEREAKEMGKIAISFSLSDHSEKNCGVALDVQNHQTSSSSLYFICVPYCIAALCWSNQSSYG